MSTLTFSEICRCSQEWKSGLFQLLDHTEYKGGRSYCDVTCWRCWQANLYIAATCALSWCVFDAMLQHVGVSFTAKQLFLLRFLVLMTAALQMKMKRLSLVCRHLCSFWETFGWRWWVLDFLQLPWPINTEGVFQDKCPACDAMKGFFFHHQPLKADPGSKSFTLLHRIRQLTGDGTSVQPSSLVY